MEQFRLSVKDKGRTLFPVGLQRACGFAPGAELVARPIGAGQFLVESSDAVLARIWSRWPSGEERPAVVTDLQQWRENTEKRRRDRLDNPEVPPEDASQRRGDALLDELGL